jgi:hypothetical protein
MATERDLMGLAASAFSFWKPYARPVIAKTLFT